MTNRLPMPDWTRDGETWRVEPETYVLWRTIDTFIADLRREIEAEAIAALGDFPCRLDCDACRDLWEVSGGQPERFLAMEAEMSHQ